MHPIYDLVQLNSKSLTQLKQIYSEIGCTNEITDKRSKQSWITAILNHQSNQVEKVEIKTCATCPLFKPFNDGTGRGLCCGSDLVTRDYHPQTGDCGHMIEDAASNPPANLPEGHQQPKVIQSSSLTYKPTKAVGTYEVWRGFEKKYGTIKMLQDGRWTHNVTPATYGTPYEAASALIETTEATQSFSKDIEVDSDYDSDFGLIYRVWKEWKLLGTFYRALDGQWVAQPCESDARPRCETATQAQLSILAIIAGRLVVGEEDDTNRRCRIEARGLRPMIFGQAASAANA